MAENSIDKLNSVLDKYEEKQTNSKNEKEKRKTEHELYLEKFRKIADEIIKPVMQEIGSVLQSKGHEYKISQIEEAKEKSGRPIHERIKMEIYPEGEPPNYINLDFPILSFVVDTCVNEVSTHVSTMMPNHGGYSKEKSKYKLSEITKEVVEEEIVSLITTSFSK